MKINRNFGAGILLLTLLSLGFQARATLAYNVSGDSNNSGAFSAYEPITPWSSGDVALPSGTTVGSTPLEVDLTLSHSVTLNASGHYSWALNYANPIAVENDLGTLTMVLLNNGVAVTTPIGFDAGPNNFGSPIYNFATGYYDNQLQNLTFNGIQVFISNSDPNGETLSDFLVSLDTPVTSAAVPEPGTFAAGALLLLPFSVSCVRMLRKNRTA